MRLDFTGRPISEYDVADNRLTCVGYWMEDTKSFLITHDPEDPVSSYLCNQKFTVNIRSYAISGVGFIGALT